ncbi:MAG: hypothetical protein KAS32_29205 [Candidatus Peribacteraceae bacterium]|nr:hypothetical protein [Candidatus Peribacteraceae bacterium]
MSIDDQKMESVKERDIRLIMNHHMQDVIPEILREMDDWKVSCIRQRFAPDWRDGFHHSLFDLWYVRDGNDKKSPAREYFTFKLHYTKYYPEQGWAPESDDEVGQYQCNVCGELVDDDDIMLNHFRNGHCKVFDSMVRNSRTSQEFWKKMNYRKNKKNQKGNQ